MTKVVDGRVIELTPEDIAEQSAKEAKWITEKASQETKDALKTAQFQRAVLLERAIIAMIKERNGQAAPPLDVVEAAKIL